MSFVLPLYRAARTLPTSDFQAFAIRHARMRLRFGAAAWIAAYRTDGATGAVLSMIPQLSYSHETDPDGVAVWKAINRTDKAIAIVFARPFTTHVLHNPTLHSGRDEAAMRDYARRFGRQNTLATALSDFTAPIVASCCLYRARADDHFAPSEQRFCQGLMAHMTEALAINRAVHWPGLATAFEADAEGETGALVSTSGAVMAAHRNFIDIVSRDWAGFEGMRIPSVVMRSIDATGRYLPFTSTLAWRARHIGDGLLWITVRSYRAAGLPLPPRRMAIASLFAQGKSNKEIARSLGISPSTVRNQLATSYRELDVSNRTELAAVLDRHRSGDASRTFARAGLRRP